ncbi:MAG: DUF86 domain-containing protein [Candidatus Omnitrophica bacterium]|nr:DUF86 domain-containing protein [Candidatus Omnitrophota bacterium]
MVDKDLVYRKLARLNTYLERLDPVAKKSLKVYLSEDYLRFSTERLIQLVVECATDINNHVVVETQNRPPEDYRTSFVKAAEVGLITLELAKKIQGSAGMRNILVHEYMDIDHTMVFAAVPKTLKYYRQYLKQVNRFLEKAERRID